jgi:hypothetical protein
MSLPGERWHLPRWLSWLPGRRLNTVAGVAARPLA